MPRRSWYRVSESRLKPIALLILQGHERHDTAPSNWLGARQDSAHELARQEALAAIHEVINALGRGAGGHEPRNRCEGLFGILVEMAEQP